MFRFISEELALVMGLTTPDRIFSLPFIFTVIITRIMMMESLKKLGPQICLTDPVLCVTFGMSAGIPVTLEEFYHILMERSRPVPCLSRVEYGVLEEKEAIIVRSCDDMLREMKKGLIGSRTLRRI